MSDNLTQYYGSFEASNLFKSYLKIQFIHHRKHIATPLQKPTN